MKYRPWGTIFALTGVGWVLHFWGPNTIQTAVVDLVLFGTALILMTLPVRNGD